MTTSLDREGRAYETAITIACLDRENESNRGYGVFWKIVDIFPFWKAVHMAWAAADVEMMLRSCVEILGRKMFKDPILVHQCSFG